jgi:hypothetical protein
VAAKPHSYHVKPGTWHQRRYQQYLARGMKPVLDFCSYWRIVLIKQPAYKLGQRWRKFKQRVPRTPAKVLAYVAGTVVAVYILASLGIVIFDIAYFIYKHEWARFAAAILAILAITGWLAMAVMRRLKTARSRGVTKAKALALEPLYTVAKVPRRAFASAADTAHFATEVVKSKKPGSLICPLLVFDDEPQPEGGSENA